MAFASRPRRGGAKPLAYRVSQVLFIVNRNTEIGAESAGLTSLMPVTDPDTDAFEASPNDPRLCIGEIRMVRRQQFHSVKQARTLDTPFLSRR